MTKNTRQTDLYRVDDVQHGRGASRSKEVAHRLLSHACRAGFLLVALAVCPPTLAQEAIFEGLGDLPGGEFFSSARAVTADGAVIIGQGAPDQPIILEAFRWEDGTMQGLGVLGGFFPISSANAVSSDGAVVVGTTTVDVGTQEAYRWTDEDGMVGLGDLEGDTIDSAASGISPDGSIIVGRGRSSDGQEAVRWVDGVIEPLGDLPGGDVSSWAFALSDDGTVMVGYGTTEDGTEAVRWEGGEIEGLGDLVGGAFGSQAWDVSADGAVVVGSGTSANGNEAFRWENGTMEGLGDLEGGAFGSEAFAVSADGSVIVGHGFTSNDAEAFIWTAQEGMRSVKELLEQDYGLDLTGWILRQAYGISADGNIIVGYGNNPDGFDEAWRAILSPQGGEPELAFDPSSLDFGDVPVGEIRPPLFATLENNGTGDATGLGLSGLPDSGFSASTGLCGDTLPAGESCEITVSFTPAEPGPAAAALMASSANGALAELLLAGTGIGDAGFTPAGLEVDPNPIPFFGDGNGVLEPGEVVEIAPAWHNDGTNAQSLTGTASGFTGPEGAVYTLALDAADYGLVDPGTTVTCLDAGGCYQMGLDDPASRPATHWDAAFDEALSDGSPSHPWTLHIGDSFADVLHSNLFYGSIEALLHSGVTGGCSANEYCPAGINTRSQMAVFLLKAAEGGNYLPPACVEGEVPFGDVSFDSTFCPWIKELADRGVTTGCGGGNYCPSAPVTRAQMAVFLLKAFEGDGYTPPECTGEFTDAPCTSPFAAWIEELAARGVTGGCAGDPPAYCPAIPVTRAQMAVFVTKTFGLTLYGP